MSVDQRKTTRANTTKKASVEGIIEFKLEVGNSTRDSAKIRACEVLLGTRRFEADLICNTQCLLTGK